MSITAIASLYHRVASSSTRSFKLIFSVFTWYDSLVDAPLRHSYVEIGHHLAKVSEGVVVRIGVDVGKVFVRVAFNETWIVTTQG